MKNSQTHGFVNQLLVCTLVIVCFSGSVGLGTVWMRQQMAQTANSIKQNQSRAIEVERRLDEARALITAEQSPDMLLQRNEEWKLGLVMPREVQVTRVRENAEQRLARKNQAERFASSPAATPADRLPSENDLPPLRLALGGR
jgi:diphthamide biosynthesis methyltransferase